MESVKNSKVETVKTTSKVLTLSQLPKTSSIYEGVNFKLPDGKMERVKLELLGFKLLKNKLAPADFPAVIDDESMIKHFAHKSFTSKNKQGEDVQKPCYFAAPLWSYNGEEFISFVNTKKDGKDTALFPSELSGNVIVSKVKGENDKYEKLILAK